MNMTFSGQAIHCDGWFMNIHPLLYIFDDLSRPFNQKHTFKLPYERKDYEVRNLEIEGDLIHLDFMPQGKATYELKKFLDNVAATLKIQEARPAIRIGSGGCSSSWKPKKPEVQ